MKGTLLEAESVQYAVFERMGKFRQKVITHRIIQGKSLKATAKACGCTPEKVKRVVAKWKMLCQSEVDKRKGIDSIPC